MLVNVADEAGTGGQPIGCEASLAHLMGCRAIA